MQELCQTILPGMKDTHYKFPEKLFGGDTAIVHIRTILEQVFLISSFAVWLIYVSNREAVIALPLQESVFFFPIMESIHTLQIILR